MPITREQARRELARRELARREGLSEPSTSQGEEGSGMTGYDVTESDLNALFSKHGVTDKDTQQELRSNAGFYAPDTWKSTDTQDRMRKLSGWIGQGVLLRAPQWILKKMEDDPNARAVIDDLRDLNMKKRSHLAAAGEVGGSIISGGATLKGLSKGIQGLSSLQKVMPLASLAGVEGAIHGTSASREGEELSGAAIGGGLGAVAAGAFAGAGPLIRRVRLDKARKGPQLADAVELDKTVSREAASMGNITRQELEEIGELRGIDKKNLNDYLKTFKAQSANPEEEIKNIVLDLRKNKLRGQKLREAGVEENRIPILTDLADFITDGKFQARIFDTKYGSNAELIIDNMSNAYNKFTVSVATVAQKKKDLLGKMKKQNVSSEDLIKKLESNPVKGEAPVVTEWRNVFEQLRQQAVKMGVNIEKRANYVPHYSVSPAQYIARVQDKVGQASKLVGKNASKFTSADIVKISNEMPELMDALAMQGGRNIRIALENSKSGAGSEGIVKMWHRSMADLMDTEQVGQKIATQAKSALQRGRVGMPDFVREKDITKLLSGWTHSTFRHAFLKDGLGELGGIQKQYQEAGLENAGRYIETLRKDLTGEWRDSSNLMYRMRRGLNQWKDKKQVELETRALNLEKQGKMPEARALRARKTAGQLVTGLVNTNNLYPYYLGLRPDAALRNLTQPITMSLPELGGGTYSVAKGVKAYARAAKQVDEILTDPKTLQKEGLLPGKWTGEAKDELYNVMESKLQGKPKEFIDKAHDAAMYMYTRSDIINRYVTKNLSEDLAEDLAKGVKGAEKFVRNLPLSYRVAMQKNPDKTAHLIKQYMLSSTQFNYNRISMSEYGRTMGGLFSMFSKWPTTILGDIRSGVQRGKSGDLEASMAATKGFQRYVAPYIAVKLIGAMTDDEEQHPAVKALTPKMSWTPGSSLKSFTDPASFATPPAFDIAGELVRGAQSFGRAVEEGEDPIDAIKWKSIIDKGAALLPLTTYGKAALRGDKMFFNGELLPFNEEE